MSGLHSDHEDSPRNEDEEHRLDRNLGELLQELRVALPGVQVLFAFLLTVPFQQNFSSATDFQRNVYVLTLLLTTLSTALLISPSAFHRVTFRMQKKSSLVLLGNKLTLAGLAALAVAMTSAIVLVTDFLFDRQASLLSAGFALLLFTLLWLVIPIFARRH